MDHEIFPAGLQYPMAALSEGSVMRPSIKPNEDVTTSSTTCEASASPFSALPDDILREICVACITGPDIPTISNAKPPMIFHYISGRIRNIALTTPSLWASAHIYLFYPTTAQDVEQSHLIDGTLAGIKKIFRLSGALPIRITFDVQRRFGMDHIKYDELATFSPRWAELNLGCCVGLSLRRRISRLAPSDLPQLRVFSTNGIYPKGEDVFQNSTLLSLAPNLTEVTIDDHRFSTLRGSLNFSQLKILCIGGVLPNRPRPIHCHLLQANSPWDGPPAIFPSLDTLHLTSSANWILTSLCAPQLRTLVVSRIPQCDYFASLSRFVQSTPHLSNMSIGVSRQMFTLSMEPLQFCRGLFTLCITSVAETVCCQNGCSIHNRAPSHSTFIEAFIHDDRERLCPNLKKFNCEHAVDIPGSATFAKFIREFGDGSLTAQPLDRIRILD